MKFGWIPGIPLNTDALDRLKQNFSRPTEPPPGTWTLSNVDYANWIIETDPNDLDTDSVRRYLDETGSGFTSFPEWQSGISTWTATFHYLLPYLIERCLDCETFHQQQYLLSDLINYLMTVHSGEVPELYIGYREDILSTLGQIFMIPTNWDENDLSSEIIEEIRICWQDGYRDEVYEVISAPMFFCLRFLTPSEIESWSRSLFSINGRHWHYIFLHWLYRMVHVLGVFETSDDLPEMKYVQETITLNHINRNMIRFPTANMKTFIKMLKEHHIYYG